MRAAAILALLLLLSVVMFGCSTPKDSPPPPKIVGDSFCSASSEQDWSVDDTKKTIDGIRQRNAGYAKRCKEGKSGG